MSDESSLGCGCVTLGAAFLVVWIGGCAVDGYNKMQRDQIYKEVWKKAPELERVHDGLSSELARLHDFRQQLEKNQRVFESPAAKEEAGRKMISVDAQIARLEAQRLAIISSVEQQALTKVSTKVENPMQRETIMRLESETQSVVGDAEALRHAIESEVSGDPLSYGSTPAPRSVEPRMPQAAEGSEPSPLRADPDVAAATPGNRVAVNAPRSTKRLFKTRFWSDRHGHQVYARLLHVADSRGKAVATLGVDPVEIAASDWVLHLQREDGAIIQVPAVKFSSRDLDFLSEGQ